MLPPYEVIYKGVRYLRDDISQPSGIPLPVGTFRQIKHDYEAKDGLVRVGMPEVLSLSLNKYCDLTEEWQWFWFRQMVHSFTNYKHWNEKNLSSTELNFLKAKWRSLTKHSEAFTNFKGTDIYKDYITPNKLSGLPGQEPLVTCGNIVKILGGSVRIAGKTVVPIETLDGNKPPPPIEEVNRLTYPHIIMSATNVPANKEDGYGKWKLLMLPDGTWQVDLFPQLAPKITPFALRTNGKEANEYKGRFPIAGTYSRNGINFAVNYIQEERIKLFAGNVVPVEVNP